MKSRLNSPHVELLESRLLLAGESVAYILEISDPGTGTPISAVEVGQTFRLTAYAQDLRATPRGVFAGYLDVTFDDALVSSAGGFSYGGSYPNVHSGSVSTGLLDEAGGVAGFTSIGGGRKTLWYMDFTADALGSVTFASDAADSSPAHDTLVYGSNSPVSSGLIAYGSTTLNIVTSISPVAQLAHPLDGAEVENVVINSSQRYIDVTFVDNSGAGIDGDTITDAAVEFTLGGAGASGVVVNGAGVLQSGTTYRYTFTNDFSDGAVTVTFVADSFRDLAGHGNVEDATQGFSVVVPDVIKPQASLLAPGDGLSIGDGVINGRGYIEVTFTDAGGSGLLESTITDLAAEVSLGGAGAAGVTLSGTGSHVSGSTYRYTFTGSFVEGPVTVRFLSGSVADGAGNALDQLDQGFTVTHVDVSRPTASLSDPANSGSIADLEINARGWIEIAFSDSGSGIDPATLLDGGAEIEFLGSSATIDPVPQDMGGGIYRYSFTGSLSPGTVSVYFTAGTFADLAANTNIVSSQSFEVVETDVQPPTGTLADPADGATPWLIVLNARGYIDVTYSDLGPSGVLASTITDAAAEFVLTGAAASGVTVNGAAVHVSGSTYRYSFSGAFAAGAVGVSFQAGAWTDGQGNPNAGFDQGFTLLAGEPEVSLVGDGQEILAGDDTPSPDDGTDFGLIDIASPVVHQFTILNNGPAPLWLTGTPRILIGGADAADFHVVAQPAGTINGGESATFQIRFAPQTAGQRNATVTIASSDSDEGVYTFSISGSSGRVIHFHGATRGAYYDIDGDAISFWLSGPGEGEIWLPGIGGDARGDADRIVLRNTGIATELKMSATGQMRRTTIGELIVHGSMKKIDINRLSITGGISIDGTVEKLVLENLWGPVGIHLVDSTPANPRATLTLGAASVRDVSLDTHGQGVKSITVWEWLDHDNVDNDLISAPWIGTLKVKGRKALVGGSQGDLEARVQTGSLGTVEVVGVLTPRNWQVSGQVGSLTAGKIDVGSIHAVSLRNLSTRRTADLAGDVVADITLDGPAPAGAAATLGKVQLDGGMSGNWQITGATGMIDVDGTVSGTIRSSGNMGDLKFGAVNGADIFAGVTTSAAGDPAVTRHADSRDDFAPGVSIRSISIKGLRNMSKTGPLFKAAPLFADSNFSAAYIGNVKVRNLVYDAGSAGASVAEQFGLWAAAVKSVSYENLANRANNWRWPQLPADTVDFVIRVL
jgi:hypothetical protein